MMNMDSKEYAKITAKNLKRILYEHEKTQADLSRDLGIAKTTVNGWIGGKRTPKMPTIDLLCQKMGLDISQKSLILCGFADFEGRIGGKLVAKIKKGPT